jgi:DNA-directed RNA polymerase specialized sigma subunit
VSATDAEKLHLVQQVASEVARKRKIADPCELWGAGWVGITVAVSKWDGRRPFLPFARRHVYGEILHTLRSRRSVLTGNSGE